MTSTEEASRRPLASARELEAVIAAFGSDLPSCHCQYKPIHRCHGETPYHLFQPSVQRRSPSSDSNQADTLETSDVESDDYSESARSYELGKVGDFACVRPRPDFSAFLCLWRKVTIGWEMRPVRLVLQNIRNFFSQNGWCLPFTKNSRSCKGSNKAESAGAKGQRKAWRAAFHDLYGCPPTFNITGQM